jgi:hypothetical protein
VYFPLAVILNYAIMVKEFQNLFIITLQIYSAIINGAIDTVSLFQSALYIIYRDFKLEFQYHRAIKMSGVLKF